MSKSDLSTTSHPSYGTVVVHRVSSTGTRLVGSSSKHHSYISIRICEAAMWDKDDEHGDRMMPGKVLLEINMSEVQFARMVSSSGLGSGTPCTLAYRQNPESVELIAVQAPPRQRSLHEDLEGIVADVGDQMNEDLSTYINEIRELFGDRLPKKKKERLEMILSVLEGKLGKNLKYSIERLNDVVESRMNKAKLEMEASARSIIQRLGLGAVADKVAGLLPGIEDGDG